MRALTAAVWLAVLAFAAPAHAAWIKAESERFVVYGDAREAVVRDYAVRLTLFDAVLRALHQLPGEPAVKRRKFEVYLVQSVGDLRRVSPALDARVAGVYYPTPRATFALAKVRGETLGRDDTLFHEYAHHFMRENFPAAYPAWFVEGWAEYYMTAEVTDRVVKVGNYNENRVYWLFNGTWLPMEDVIGKSPWEIRRDRRHLYYSQAWLLTHYMKATPERAEQLNRASRAIAAGEQPLKAFRDATGMDMDQLTKEMWKYRKLSLMALNLKEGQTPAVTVTRLPAAAEEFMLDRLRLAISSIQRPDPALLEGLRRRAARFAGDDLADLTLAQAEFLWGDVAAGEAIVARRLKAKPDDVETLLMAGVGQMLAGERDRPKLLERYRAARPLLAKAYQLDKTDYRPIFAYAYSRTVEPNFPTDNDLNVALEARTLAPNVAETSFLAGSALTRRGRHEDARKALAVVANNPHGGRMAIRAREMMAGKSEQEAAAAAEATPEEPEAPAPEEPTPPAKPAKAATQ